MTNVAVYQTGLIHLTDTLKVYLPTIDQHSAYRNDTRPAGWPTTVYVIYSIDAILVSVCTITGTYIRYRRERKCSNT
ncbi:hypothetical protein F4Z99_11790 [Candidatus Poribacteria bacterium]|nr:hypothetical protein [Candidatus Poribacteria bacterium]